MPSHHRSFRYFTGHFPLKLSTSTLYPLSSHNGKRLIVAIHCCQCWMQYLPRSAEGRHFARRHADAIPGVDDSDGDDQRRHGFFVVMPGSFIPEIIRHRIRAVAEAGGGFGEGEGAALGSAKNGDSRHAAPPKIRSSVSPIFLRSRACMSTQKLQPLIWLARSSRRWNVASGTPLFFADLPTRAWPAWLRG